MQLIRVTQTEALCLLQGTDRKGMVCPGFKRSVHEGPSKQGSQTHQQGRVEAGAEKCYGMSQDT